MKRTLVAGLVAGVVLFLWLSIVHMATPLGMVGISEFPAAQEAAVTSPMASLPAAGLYFFPGSGAPAGASSEEKRAAMSRAMEKMKTSPTGILIVHPRGAQPMTPGQLLTEFGGNLLQGLLLAWLLAQTALVAKGRKIAFAAAVGLVAAVATNVSYWNWYGFPTNYTAVYMFTAFAGYVLMGATIAIITTTSQKKLVAAQ